MKLSPFLLFAFAPLAVHTHQFVSADPAVLTSRVAMDSVQYINADGDTTHITTDSAGRLVKALPAQVVFLRIGSNPGVRVKRQALAKIKAASITNLQVEEDQSVVMQYGDVAKSGVLTVTVKPSTAQSEKKQQS
jgi:hypothetical protein